jgi:hypothetical protein
MAIEFDIRIIGESTPAVIEDLRQFAAHLSSVMLVGPLATDTPDTPAPAASEGNGAGKPASTRKRTTATAAAAPEVAKIDRAAIIEGLTKIYSKGDEDVRLAITKFRDGQGADRLRDLKDDALPAAAELLTELKLAAESPAV